MTYYAKLNPDFLIRIHSGENTNDISGIKDALKIIKKESSGYNDNYPRIRIGHAIHGCDEETIKLMKEMNVSIELNLASNLKLGNLYSVQDEELKKAIELCKENGIPIFLGTDGHGIYCTTPEKQREYAAKAGIDLINIIQTENKYIVNEFQRTDKERVKLTRKKTQRAKSRIKFKLEQQGVNIVEGQEASGLKGKIPIIIAGSSLKTRGDGNFEEYKKLELAFQTLSNVIHPGRAYFVTGGTNCGPERFMHNAINKRDTSTAKSKLRCLGVIPSYIGRLDDSNAQNDFFKLEKGTITDALIVDSYSGWDDFAEHLIIISNNQYKGKENGPKGFAIFAGGGETLKTELRLANKGGKNNQSIPCLVYSGFEKAESSKFLKDNGDESEKFSSFSNAEDLIKNIYEIYGNEIFFNGFDIEKLSYYIEKSKKNTNFNYQIIENTLIDEGKFGIEQLERIKDLIRKGVNAEEIQKLLFLDKNTSKDIGVFIDAYKSYFVQKSATEVPKSLTEDVRLGSLFNGIVNKIKSHITKGKVVVNKEER